MIIGGGLYNFEDGTSVSNSQDFVDKIESEYQSSIANQENWGWRTVYAFFFIPSDQMTPQQTIKTVNGSTPSLKLLTQLILRYHIVDGKLNTWYQAKGDFTFSEQPISL
jgi:hypothetical protein